MIELTRDVPRERWQRELDELSMERLNAPTALDVITGGRAAGQGRGLLLRSLSYDPRHDEFCVLVVSPSPRGERMLRHVVSSPTAIRTDGRNGVLATHIGVDDALGTRTLVRLGIAVPDSG